MNVAAVGRDDHAATRAADADAEPPNWVAALSGPGPAQAAALRKLHDLLLHASRHQAWRMRAVLAGYGADVIEEIANQAADEAMVALLAKLPTFQGRSRFSTWAYKFAILQVSVEARRYAWLQRQVTLQDPELIVEPGASPEQHAEATDLALALRSAIAEVLTPHQRHIVLGLLVNEIPIDVLADRLGSTRNALYKTLHDARGRLRAHLYSTGHLVDPEALAGTR